MRNYRTYLYSQGYSIPFEKPISFPNEVVQVRDVIIFGACSDENFIVIAVDHSTNSLYLESKSRNTAQHSLRQLPSITARAAASHPSRNVAPHDVQMTCITDVIHPQAAFDIVIKSAQLQQHRNHADGTLTIADDPASQNRSTFRINRVVWVITPAHNRCFHGIFFLIPTTLAPQSPYFERITRDINEFIGIYEYDDFFAPPPQEYFTEFTEQDEPLYHNSLTLLPYNTTAITHNYFMSDGMPLFSRMPGKMAIKNSTTNKLSRTCVQPSRLPKIPSIPKVVWMIGVPGIVYSAGSFVSHWFLKKYAAWKSK